LYTFRARDFTNFSVSLQTICSFFASEHRLRSQFFDTFIGHPLMQHLIDFFDDPQMSKFSELISELFVNISAISPQFWQIFMPSHNFRFLGYEKIIHVRDSLSPNCLFPLLLFYNAFSWDELRDYVLYKCADFKYYLDCTHFAIQSSDYQTVFIAPLVLMSLLRGGAIPTNVALPYTQFVNVMAEVMRVAGPRDMLSSLWAIYFWFKHNWSSPKLWDSISNSFVSSLSRLLDFDDRNVVRLALYANAFLWLIPEKQNSSEGENRKEVIEGMKDCFNYVAIGQCLDSEDSEIIAYGLAVLTNFVSFGGSCADALASHEIDFLQLAVEVLKEGSVEGKIQATYFVCAFARSSREIENQVTSELVSLLIDALELEEVDMCVNILELLVRLTRRFPQCAEFLIEQQFEQYLMRPEKKGKTRRRLEEQLGQLLMNYRLEQENLNS
jgi:hypothetical protein